MDGRKALAPGVALPFPGMECIIEQEIGRGSNAIVYRGWYADALDKRQRHHVLVKELFPYHEKAAIYRAEDGQTVLCGDEGQSTLQLHTQSFVWGNEVHLALRERHPSAVGGNLNSFSLNQTYYTILDFSGGRDFKTECQTRPAGLRQTVQRMLGVLDSLDVFHRMGYLHLDISPDNILITDGGARERIELIDYNSVVAINALQAGQDIRFSAKAGFASPEVRTQALASLGPWTDLYSVTAVFFAALMGRTLERMEQSGVKVIDPSSCPALKDMPETVKSMVRQIMNRGLATVAKKRYASVEAMQTDLLELLDRIDGVGVTHWALWEMSRAGIQREVRLNPALAYIADERELYPIEVGMPSSLDAFLAGRCHAVVCGSGGMGKTTFLMRTAWQESRAYRRDRAAVLYLPLYGYQPGDAHFIHDSILRRLKFKPDMDSYANARHALDVLVQRPLRTKSGERPVLCLMLDGYNEISGDTQALQKEIEQLAQMEGVRVLLSTRTPPVEFAFETWHMQPLAESTVRSILAGRHLLMPQGEQMQTLLLNPMMLSLFVRASCESGEQLFVQSREELVDAYLRALMQKELGDLGENAPEKWQLKAALECAYPLIADWEMRRRSGQGSLQLLSIITSLFTALGSRALLKRFPAYVGHAADIRGGAKDGDEWYGLIIHDLLWRRLGLLRQDENGVYRMAHQEFCDVLCASGKPIRELLARRKSRRAALTVGMSALLALAVGFGAFSLLRKEGPPAYAIDHSYELLQTGLSMLYDAFYQCDGMIRELDEVTAAQHPTSFDDPTLQACHPTLFLVAAGEANRDLMLAYGEGYVMPWSGNALRKDTYNGIIAFYTEQKERYARFARVYQQMLDDPEYYARFGGDYAALLAEALDADAHMLSWYYYDFVVPELDGMKDQAPDQYARLTSIYPLPQGMPVSVDISLPLDEAHYRRLWMKLETSPPVLYFSK